MTRTLYFIQACIGPIKIGVSNSVEWRLATFQATSPVKLYIRFSIDIASEVIVKVERRLHNVFARQHSHGEWYFISVEEAKQALFNLSGFQVHGIKQKGDRDQLLITKKAIGANQLSKITEKAWKERLLAHEVRDIMEANVGMLGI